MAAPGSTRTSFGGGRSAWWSTRAVRASPLTFLDRNALSIPTVVHSSRASGGFGICSVGGAASVDGQDDPVDEACPGRQ